MIGNNNQGFIEMVTPSAPVQTAIKNISNPHPDSSARISLRAVTGLEVASVIASVFITTWVIIPLQPNQRWLVAVPGLLALALIVNSFRVRGDNLIEIGLSVRHFGLAIRLLVLPTLLFGSVFLAIGYFNQSFHRTSNFWANVAFLPLWGLTQQFILQGFIFRRMRFLLVDETASEEVQKRSINFAILATAVIFALSHAPNPMLTIFTLIGALIWSWVYQRAPNLLALGLSHAMMSLMVMTCLPPWLLPSLSVGYKHFLYQKF